MVIVPTPRLALHITTAHEIREEAGVTQTDMDPISDDTWNCVCAHKADENNGARRTENKHCSPYVGQKTAGRDARKRSFPSRFPVAGRAHVYAKWRRAAA